MIGSLFCVYSAFIATCYCNCETILELSYCLLRNPNIWSILIYLRVFFLRAHRYWCFKDNFAIENHDQISLSVQHTSPSQNHLPTILIITMAKDLPTLPKAGIDFIFVIHHRDPSNEGCTVENRPNRNFI